MKAGALPFAIFIMLVIISICGSLTGIHFYYNQYYKKEALLIKLNDDIYSAVNTVLVDNGIFEKSDSAQVFLLDDSTRMVRIIKKQWGAYEVYLVEAGAENITQRKVVLAGVEYDSKSAPALYLADHNNYLYSVGKVKLKGNLWVPGGTVKQGLISGRGYDNNLVIEGNISESKSSLPVLSTGMIRSIKEAFSGLNPQDSLIITNQDKFHLLELKNSFTKKTIFINSPNSIILENCNLEGNIVVYSDKSIEINPGAKLEGVILSAPYISVKEKFEGTIQVFAADSVNVEKDCHLKYPGFVGLTGDSCNIMSIGKNSIVEGGIALISNNTKAKLTICAEAEIVGIIYSQQNLECYGNVMGSVFSNSITYNFKSSIYNNYISDIEINSVDVPEFFIAPIIIENQKKKKNITWGE